MPPVFTVQDVCGFLERFAPPSLAEDWDNVGLQLGRPSEKVRGILVSLDVTPAVLQEACAFRANLIVTHHPLLFRAIKKIDDSAPPLRLVREAILQDINILSFHTNLDSTREGLNDFFARRLGLRRTSPLISARDRRYPQAGLGRVGEITQTTLGKWIDEIGKWFGLRNFRYVGNPDQKINRVAVMTGSGGEYFREAKASRAQVLVTGDVKYHSALDALDEGIALIDIGHYASEIGMTTLVAEKLQSWLKSKKCKTPVKVSEMTRDPFLFWKS